jgi:hypothetical protein
MSIKNFSELRKNSGNFETLAKTLKDQETRKSFKDPRDEYFWRAAVDKLGNGEAVIRFLPAPEGEDLPWVQLWSHSFQNQTNGKWYIENCPTTIGGQCPLCEDNGEHWHKGEEGEKFVRERKSARKLSYIANIYVVNDPANPENNGKVFLFKFGAKIHGKIKQCIDPQFKTDTPWNPSDLWEGANFKLRITKDLKSKQTTYDSSAFDVRGPLSKDDAALENIWKQEYSLTQFIEAKEFKSYEDLKKRLDFVLGAKQSTKTIEDKIAKEDSMKEVSEKNYSCYR